MHRFVMHQIMLTGTAGQNEGHYAHLLDARRTFHEVWNEMAALTIAHCWAKSAILTPTMNSDI